MTDIRTTNLANATVAVAHAAEEMVDAKGLRARMAASKRLVQIVRAYQYIRDKA